MKRAFTAIAVVVLFAACNRAAHSGAAQTKTETIAPAQAQPAPTGTDAMTQTTEIEDSRSEGEGGVSEGGTPAQTRTSTAPPSRPATKKHK